MLPRAGSPNLSLGLVSESASRWAALPVRRADSSISHTSGIPFGAKRSLFSGFTISSAERQFKQERRALDEIHDFNLNEIIGRDSSRERHQ